MMLIGLPKEGGRTYNLCSCDACEAFFKRRSDYKSFALCLSCSNKKGGITRSTHGENNRNSKLHSVWNNMLSRCKNPKNQRFKSYGAKGIGVCDSWLSYESFREWCVSNGWNESLTIDRIDHTKGYSPENCRFTDKSVQNANRGVIRTNTSGFTGVWFSKGAFSARVIFRGCIVDLGRFKTIQEAVKSRDSEIIKRGWPHALSGLENYSVDDLKTIASEYRNRLKKLKENLTNEW